MQLHMPRDEMLARMSSRELTHWIALAKVHEDEAEHRKLVAESGDGQVFISGGDDDIEDEDDESDDGDL